MIETRIYARETFAKRQGKSRDFPQGAPVIFDRDKDERIFKKLQKIKGVDYVRRLECFAVGNSFTVGYLVNGEYNPAIVLHTLTSEGCTLLTQGICSTTIKRINEPAPAPQENKK